MSLKDTFARWALGLYFLVFILSIYFSNLRLVQFPENTLIWALYLVCTLLFAINKWLPLCGIILEIFLFRLSQQNPFLKEIHYDYLGWMLCYFVFWQLCSSTPERTRFFQKASLFVFGLSYAASGLAKLQSPHWQDGVFLEFVSRKSFFLSWTEGLWPMVPLSLWAAVAKAVMALEIFALPAIFVRQLRPIAWGLLTFLQLGLALTTEINHISVALLIFHLLVFDPEWFQKRSA